MVDSNKVLVQKADVILVAVKPYDVHKVLFFLCVHISRVRNAPHA